MAVTTGQTHWWPWLTGPAVTPGVEQYFQFLQRQAEINRQVAISWAAVVAPVPGAVLARARSAENPVAAERTTADTRVARAQRRRGRPAPTRAEPTEPSDQADQRKNDLFDDIVDALIDTDIKATR